MVCLLHVQVIARSDRLVEDLKFEAPSGLQPLSIGLMDWHGEILRLVVPRRIAVRFNLTRLHELVVLSAREAGLHEDVGVGGLVGADWVLIRIPLSIENEMDTSWASSCSLIESMILV